MAVTSAQPPVGNVDDMVSPVRSNLVKRKTITTESGTKRVVPIDF